jgi:hypothetical protein
MAILLISIILRVDYATVTPDLNVLRPASSDWMQLDKELASNVVHLEFG